MRLMEVGIRELRADLSRWVKRVRNGDEVIVTERGKPVARLVPFVREPKIDQLVREGLATPPRRPWKGPLPKPLEGIGPLSDLVREIRS
jgi:prevent-host-death family protein